MKCLLKLLALAVLLVLLLVGGVIALLNPMVKTAVTEGFGYATHQDTTLESAKIGLFSGEVSMTGLEIANPPGFQETPVFKLGHFETRLAPSGLAADVIELDVVKLDGLDLALEIKGTETNITQLVQRLQELQAQLKQSRGAGGDKPSTDEQPPAEPLPEEAGPVMKINRIEIGGVGASLRISDIPLANGVYAFQVPDLVLENFSSDMDGATMIEWSAHVLESILASALTAGESQLPPAVQSVLKSDLFQGGVLGSLLDGDLKQIGGQLEDAAKQKLDEVLEGAKQDPAGTLDKQLEEVKKGSKALDGLFGGKKDGK